MCDAVFFRVLFLEARFNDVIGFKSRNHNIEDPEENKDTSGDSFDAICGAVVCVRNFFCS